MKKFLTIASWILLSLIIQLSGYFYLDKYYLSAEAKIKTTKVITETKKQAKKTDIPVKDEYKNVSISYNGKYISYIDGSIIKVVDIENGTGKSIKPEEGATLSYYKWLPDRNRIVIAEKGNSKKGNVMKFYNYDVTKDSKEAITETVHNINTVINLPDDKSEVQDIALSTLSNVMYVKICNSGKKSSIYRFDIMAEMSKVRTEGGVVGDINVTHIEDHLVYEDTTYKKIRKFSGDSINLGNIKNPCLIAADNEDNIYIGQVEGDKVNKIIYGKVTESTEKWKSIDLKTASDKKDIYILPGDGSIYVNDNLKGIVTNASTGKETKYTGIFLQMYNKGVYSVSDGKLTDTLFK